MNGTNESAARLIIELPEWPAKIAAEYSEPLTSDEARMGLTIRLSQENV